MVLLEYFGLLQPKEVHLLLDFKQSLYVDTHGFYG